MFIALVRSNSCMSQDRERRIIFRHSENSILVKGSRNGELSEIRIVYTVQVLFEASRYALERALGRPRP